jgi:hypothetical protein
VKNSFFILTASDGAPGTLFAKIGITMQLILLIKTAIISV